MDHQQNLKKARPQLPAVLSDRAADNWEPLLAIAEMAGHEWLNLAQNACFALSHQKLEKDTMVNHLLNNIHRIFLSKKEDKISANDLIDQLCEDQEWGWKNYNNGSPINAKQISNLLKPYGISSKDIKLQGNNLKGV